MEEANLILIDIEERMDKAVQALRREFTQIRTGRANPGILDRITVSYYGVDTPLKQISSIQVVEGSQLYIKPYDKTSLKDIEHSIYASNLGINPINDGVGIRLIFPQPTEERRKELVREVEKMGEGAKVAVRNIRRDGNDQVKKLEMSEDDEKGYLQDVQELTDDYVKKVDEEVKLKADELLTI